MNYCFLFCLSALVTYTHCNRLLCLCSLSQRVFEKFNFYLIPVFNFYSSRNVY